LRFVLVHEAEVALIKDAEPFFPGNLLQRLFASESREINANDSTIAGATRRPPDYGRMTAARFSPFANLLMIGRGLR
jgi:hypothetical protein